MPKRIRNRYIPTMKQKKLLWLNRLALLLASIVVGFWLQSYLVIDSNAMKFLQALDPTGYFVGKILGFALAILMMTALLFFVLKKTYQWGSQRRLLFSGIVVWVVWFVVVAIGASTIRAL